MQGKGVKKAQNIIIDFSFLRQTCLRGPEEAEIFTPSHFELSFQINVALLCLQGLWPWTGKAVRVWTKL